MKYPQFQKKIKEVSPLYILTGPEIFLKQEAIKLIKSNLGEENLFFKEYEGDNFSLSQFTSDIYCQPLFEEWNLIIVKKATSIVTSLHDTLIKYLESPPSFTIIIIEIDKIDQRTRFAKLASSKGVVVECTPLKDKNARYSQSELSKWLMVRVQYYQKEITPDAAHHLEKYVGSNLNDLDLQLQKLSLYLQQRKKIELKDVQILVEDKQRANVFEFMDAIFQKQCGKTLLLARQLFHLGNVGQDGNVIMNSTHIALQSMRLMHYRLRQIWKSSVAKEPSDIPPFLRRKISQQATLYNPQELSAIWLKLLEIESALKLSQVTSDLAIEQLIVFIAGNVKH